VRWVSLWVLSKERGLGVLYRDFDKLFEGLRWREMYLILRHLYDTTNDIKIFPITYGLNSMFYGKLIVQ